MLLILSRLRTTNQLINKEVKLKVTENPQFKEYAYLSSILYMIDDDPQLAAKFLESLKKVKAKADNNEMLYAPSNNEQGSLVWSLHTFIDDRPNSIPTISNDDIKSFKDGTYQSISQMVKKRGEPVTLTELMEHPHLKGMNQKEAKAYLMNDCGLLYVNNWWSESHNGRSQNLKGYVHPDTPRKDEKPRKLYLLELEDVDGTTFYKIGVSAYPEDRLKDFKAKGVEGSVYKVFDSKSPFKEEKEYKQLFKSEGLLYKPVVQGLPESECFKFAV